MRTLFLHISISFAIATLVSACSFNNLFYYPDTEAVPPAEKGEDVYLSWNEKDTFHGVFYSSEKAVGSIYILHGNAGSLTGWIHVAEIFQRAGYNAFIIDYPGFGNSDKKPRHNRTIAAAQAGFDYFKERPEVKGTQKILLGMSLGGNLATKIGVDNQEFLDAMVLEGPFSSHRKVGMTRVPPFLRPIAFFGVRSRIKGQQLMKKWKKPLLVIHSEEDKVCPYEQGVELYERSTSIEKELWTIQGKHLRGLTNYRAEYLQKVKQLIAP